ncbi:MAG: CRISPR-associated endonuclease Cas1 [Gemmatimonadales bacterium]|nr:CRISPR-associated endonuclease Cas1 [Gemmatimonadales bacterium]
MTGPLPFEPAHGVLILRGFSLSLRVNRGHLVIEDESLGVRRLTRLSRIDREVRRLIVVGSSGAITLDAIKWLDGVGLPLIHLHPDGRVLMVAAPSAAHRPPVRRAQALAATNDVGLQISRRLLVAKVQGQRDLLARLEAPREIRHEVASAHRLIEHATDFDVLRLAEAQAAQAYWSAWRQVPIRIAAADRARCPRHWSVMGARHSPLGSKGSNRAVSPANALLNYGYAVLEGEARIACLAVGLDPLLGLLHTDRTARGALALDLMEPIRPAVDRVVLDLLRTREFSRRDLFELPDGQCRLMPPVTEPLAAAAGRWARLVLPVAQSVLAALLDAAEKAPKPRHHGASPYRRRRRLQVRTMREFEETRERLDPAVDPRYRGAAVRRRQRTMDGIYRANATWKTRGAPAMRREEYVRQVVPMLGVVPLKRLMAATGLTNASCSYIRRGMTVPHPRHWPALAHLADGRR